MLRSSDMATPKRRTPIVAVARCMIVAKTIMAIVGLRRMRRGETRPPVLQQWEILPQVSYDELRRLEVMDCHRRGQQYAQSEKRRLTWIGMCPRCHAYDFAFAVIYRRLRREGSSAAVTQT